MKKSPTTLLSFSLRVRPKTPRHADGRVFFESRRPWNSRIGSIVAVALIASTLVAPSAGRADVAREPDEVIHGTGALPLSFEPNVGQFDEQVAFVARSRGYSVFLTQDDVVLSIGGAREPALSDEPRSGATRSDATRSGATRSDRPTPTVLRMRCQGAGAVSRVVGLEELPGKANYLLGDDPSKWRTEIPTYARVRYEGVYDGVDLDLHGNQQQVEYDFRVAPGADPSLVRVRFDGAESVDVDASGTLVLRLRDGEIRQQRARVYQDDGNGKREVAARYLVSGDGEVGFELGSYDASRMLVIDPVLAYSTYLGGSDSDEASGIAVDGTGAVYVAGDTYSTNFPTATPIQATNAGLSDVFVTKLNPEGTAVVYSTYLGGSSDDGSTDIAVDGSGLAYVTGFTWSPNFPTANALQGTNRGADDVFVAKLNATGTSLVYSTYLGGSGVDVSRGIAILDGAAYVSGFTASTNFPTASPIQAINAGAFDVFVAKLAASGTSLVYSTFLGGPNWDLAGGVAVDGAGAAFVTGHTYSSNFPLSNPIQSVKVGDYDGFVTKLSPAGTSLVYSTYLGGSAEDYPLDVAVDGDGAAYVAGNTNSANFPTANAFQAANAGNFDGFVTKFSPVGTSLVYSTFLGGTNSDSANAITVDANGAAHVTGDTFSTDFPTENPIQAASAGSDDAFVTKLTSSGALLAYSTYVGGLDDDEGSDIAVNAAGEVFVAGETESANFPTAFGSAQALPFQRVNAGATDAFVLKVPVLRDTLAFAADSFSVDEGGIATVTVARVGNNLDTLTVDYATSDNTATAAAGDYMPTSGTLVFPAGTATQTFTVQTTDDAEAQGNRALELTLSAASPAAALGAAGSAPLTIVDDEPAGALEFEAVAPTTPENILSRSALVRVKRVNGSSGTVTVDYATSNNTAVAGTDYSSRAGTLTLADGVTSAVVAVPIVNDSIAEGNESLHLTLSNPTGGAVLGSARRSVLTILDDDTPSGRINFSAVSYRADEGGAARIVITRTNTTTFQTVLFSTSNNGTAQSGVDYTAVTQLVTFRFGQRQANVVVSTTADGIAEGSESVNLTLSNPTGGATLGARRTAVFTFDDATGALAFSTETFVAPVNAFTTGSGVRTVTIAVARTGGNTGTVTVRYATSNNTAVAGTDYTATNGQLTFGPGETTKTFDVTILPDAGPAERNESLNLTLTTPTGGATLGNRSRAVLVIAGVV